MIKTTHLSDEPKILRIHFKIVSAHHFPDQDRQETIVVGSKTTSCVFSEIKSAINLLGQTAVENSFL